MFTYSRKRSATNNRAGMSCSCRVWFLATASRIKLKRWLTDWLTQGTWPAISRDVFATKKCPTQKQFASYLVLVETWRSCNFITRRRQSVWLESRCNWFLEVQANVFRVCIAFVFLFLVGFSIKLKHHHYQVISIIGNGLFAVHSSGLFTAGK